MRDGAVTGPTFTHTFRRQRLTGPVQKLHGLHHFFFWGGGRYLFFHYYFRKVRVKLEKLWSAVYIVAGVNRVSVHRVYKTKKTPHC